MNRREGAVCLDLVVGVAAVVVEGQVSSSVSDVVVEGATNKLIAITALIHAHVNAARDANFYPFFRITLTIPPLPLASNLADGVRKISIFAMLLGASF